MKMISRFLMAIAVVSTFALASCSKGSKEVSSTTGWQYNNPAFGGFEYKSGYEQYKGPGLVFIEGGTFIMGRVEQDVIRLYAIFLDGVLYPPNVENGKMG